MALLSVGMEGQHGWPFLLLNMAEQLEKGPAFTCLCLSQAHPAAESCHIVAKPLMTTQHNTIFNSIVRSRSGHGEPTKAYSELIPGSNRCAIDIVCSIPGDVPLKEGHPIFALAGVGGWGAVHCCMA